ncbi:MAG: hypothetical protein ACXVBE_04795 [Bdellovibrionota bacterium]
MKSLLLFAALNLAACSSQQYQYVADLASSGQAEPSRAEGHSEVSYSIPSGSQSGKVQVLSMGVVEVEPKHDAKRVHSIHLRLTVSNHSPQKWLVDSEEQKVSYPTGGRVPPSFVNSDSALPKLEIPPGELRLVDLYFALPTGMSTARDLTSFNFHWQVQDTNGNAVAEQTTLFNRRPIPELPVIVAPYSPYLYSPGWGPVWWGGGFFYEPGTRPGPSFHYRAK